MDRPRSRNRVSSWASMACLRLAISPAVRQPHTPRRGLKSPRSGRGADAPFVRPHRHSAVSALASPDQHAHVVASQR